MKKIMFFLLGALLASALPGNGLKAQNVNFTVKTLDRTPLQSATIYFLPSASQVLDTSALDTVSLFDYNLTANGFQVSGMRPSYVHGDTVVIKVIDTLGRCYIYGTSDSAQRAAGTFSGGPLFAVNDSILGELTVTGSLLGAYDIVARDNEFAYSSVTNAAALTTTDSISLVHNTNESATIGRGLLFNLNGNTLAGTLSITHNEGTLYLQNGAINSIIASNSDTGAVIINGLDSVGYFNANTSHPITINGGRFHTLSPLNGARLTINGGKFAQGPDDLAGYLANRRVLQPNTDADAASFAYKVVEGYIVVYVNFDGRGHNDTVLYNNPENLAQPLPMRPIFSTDDTTFSGYWTDAAFTNAWNFNESVLESDTTILYAKWSVFDPVKTFRLRVNFKCQNINGGYDLADSLDLVLLKTAHITAISTIDTTFPTSWATKFKGYSPQAGATFAAYTGLITRPDVNDTIEFLYDRNRYVITWDFSGATYDTANFAHYDAATGTVTDTLYYKDTIVFPDTLILPGYHLAGWDPVVTTMPNDPNLIITANFLPNAYEIVWVGDKSVTYTAYSLNKTVRAEATDPVYDPNPAPVVYTYTDENGNSLPGDTIVTVGNYIISVQPADTAYHLTGETTFNIAVTPFPVQAIAIIVDTVKLYDGSDSAHVVALGHTDTILGTPTDDMQLGTVTARFTHSEPGEGLGVVVYIDGLVGVDAYNYTLEEDVIYYSFNGIIVNVVDFEAPLAASLDGYCAGSTQIGFTVKPEPYSANPDQYKVVFSDAAKAQGFQDIDWTGITGSAVEFNVPESAMPGDYTAEVSFRESQYVQYGDFTSGPVTINFSVNAPESLVRPMFSNVVTIMNNDPNIHIDTNTITWWHRGDGETRFIAVGKGPYYQETGSDRLTGEYYAEFNFSYGDADGNTVSGHTRTCVQDDLTDSNRPTDAPNAVVTAYPNPTVGTVSISIENATQLTHTLRVMNIMGVTLLNTTFDGDATSIDFSRFGNGSYTVSVDGIVVRVIKK